MRIYRNPYVLLAQAREDAMAERARRSGFDSPAMGEERGRKWRRHADPT